MSFSLKYYFYMIKTALGINGNNDFVKAGQDAAKEAINVLGTRPDLFLVTTPFGFNSEQVLAGINSVAQDVPIAGGTAGWGIITRRGIKEKEAVVLAMKFEGVDFQVVSVGNLSKDAEEAGVGLGKKILEVNGTPPQFMLLFCSGLGVAIDVLLEGLKRELGSETDILGGGTGDSMALKNGGNQFYNDQLLQDSAVAVGFWGGIEAAVMAEHGWEPLGLEMEITKSNGIIISEIDNKPAAQIFEKYFTEAAIMDPSFFSPKGEGILYPLGIISKKPERITIRQVVGVGPKGELIFASNVPQGATARIMQAQTTKMIDVANNIGGTLRESNVKSPQAVFVFDCVIRRLLLMPDQHKEIDAFIDGLGSQAPLFGFFSYGEICSKKKEEQWLIHNETFAAGLLG